MLYKNINIFLVLTLFVFKAYGSNNGIFLDDSTSLYSTVPYFIVNDRVESETSYQTHPSIDGDSDGNYVVVWNDYRNGSQNIDIFGQRVSKTGYLQGNNFRINDDTLSINNSNPVIAYDDNGNFVVAWADNRMGLKNIYAQMYFNNGEKNGENFKVNIDTSGNCHNPDICNDNQGNFVIAWHCDEDIYFQRFLNDGERVGCNIKVNTFNCNYNRRYVKISSDNTGNFIILWCSGKKVFFQRYDYIGNVISNIDSLNLENSVNPMNQNVAMDSEGNFMIIWTNFQYEDLYAQYFEKSGKKVGDIFQINSKNYSQLIYSECSVSSIENKKFIIVWKDYRYSYSHESLHSIFYQICDENRLVGQNFKVNEGPYNSQIGAVITYSPEVYADAKGNYYITWIDSRFKWSLGNVFVQKYSNDHRKILHYKKLNDENVNVDHFHPSITTGLNDDFSICWEEESNIYMKQYKNDGTQKSNLIVIENSDIFSEMPSMANDSCGNYIVQWQEIENDNYEVVYQAFDSTGNSVSNKFNISNIDNDRWNKNSGIASNNKGEYISVWIEESNDIFMYDVFTQRLDNLGNKLGEKIKVNPDDTYTSINSVPAVDIDELGNYFVLWTNYSDSSGSKIFLTKISAGNNINYSPIQLNTDTLSADYPSISIDDFGNIIVAWVEFEYNYTEPGIERGIISYLNFRSFSPELDILGEKKKINEYTHAEIFQTSIKLQSNGKAFLAWSDHSICFDDLYGQQILFPDMLIGKNILISSNFPVSNVDLSYHNDRIYCTWQDGKYDVYDIAAKILSHEKPIIIDKVDEEIVETFSLKQNYPNPFNPRTTIQYYLPEKKLVEIRIYDILGREVKLLESQIKPAGIYSITFDATGFSTGIYFYQIKVGDKIIKTKKMLYLK